MLEYLNSLGFWLATAGLQIILVLVLTAVALRVINPLLNKAFQLKM